MSKTRPTTLPGFPKIPITLPPEVRKYLEALSEVVEIRVGRRGDPRDRAITLRELIDSGLALELEDSPFDPNAYNENDLGFVPVGDGVGGVMTPTAPTNFVATGVFETVNLTFDFPRYTGHSQTQVWRHTSDSITSAVNIGNIRGRGYVDVVGGGQTFYYWIRHENVRGVVGPWNSSAGTVATTLQNTNFLLSALNNALTTSELSSALATQLGTYQTASQVNTLIGNATILANAPAWQANGVYEVGDIVHYVYNETSPATPLGSRRLMYICTSPVAANTNDSIPTVSTTSPYWDLFGDSKILSNNNASITDINTISSSSNSAAAQKIAALNVNLGLNQDGSGTPTLSATNFSTMASAVFSDVANNTLRATSTQIDFLSSSYTNPETGTANNVSLQQALNTSASNINGLRGQYTVKIDVNNHVAGFGLANTATAEGNAISEFIVRADRFALMNVTALANTAAWSSSNAYSKGAMVKHGGLQFQAKTAVSAGGTAPSAVTGSGGATNWDCLSTPFTVITSQQTGVDDGKGGTITIPPGVYIRNAAIQDASIEAAKIKNLTAEHITTGTLNVTELIEANAIEATKLRLDNVSLSQGSVTIGGQTFQALRVAAIDADNVTITNLKVDNLTGDVNTIEYHTGNGSRQFGPTSAGYVELSTFDCDGNSEGKAHRPTLNIIFSARFENDTASVKVEVATVTGGSVGSYNPVQELEHFCGGVSGANTTIPVIAAMNSNTTSDVRFKVSIKMFGDQGSPNNTNASNTGTANWRGYTVGLV